MKPRNKLPLQLFAACLIGLLLGKFCFSTTKEKVELSLFNGKLSKMQSIINIIDNKYVDPVDIDSINELIIPNVLSLLDPHSTYIPAQKLNDTDKKLLGHFNGIGIEYIIFNDTATIINIAPGGPASNTALRQGDKIVEIDGGNVISPDDKDLIAPILKNENSQQICIGHLRQGSDSIIKTEITRGDVPVPSITASYMADSATAYIKMESFGDNSYDEFMIRMDELLYQGARNLIIDLRGNLGGRVEQAKRIASEVLNFGDTIVFTIGREQIIEDLSIDTTHDPICQGMHIACLVDSRTASAAEILSAAIQDNDRGIIIGRRTFGKGLVQTPILMQDGSQVRLTTQRYYTPSGRSLQKSYENYENDLSNRSQNYELDSADAFKVQDSTKYYTKNGRTVYSKCGVIPDYFVPVDRTIWPPLVYQIDSMMAITHFAAVKYNTLGCDNPLQFADAMFSDEKATYDELIDFARRKGLDIDPRKNKKEIAESFEIIMAILKSDAYHIAGDEDMCIRYYNYDDHDLAAAIELLGDPEKINNILNSHQ